MQRKHIQRIVILVIIIGVIVALKVSGLGGKLTLGNLKANGDHLEHFVAQNYLLSVVSYIAIYIAVAGLSIPGATVMTLAGGFLFGTILAAIYVNVGATIGATLAFLFARYIAGGWLQAKYADKLRRFNDELARNGSYYMLTLRFIAVFPFWLINICAGLTSIPLRTFVWTTAVGILPGSLVYTYAGSQLATIQSVSDIFTTRILIAFLLLAALAMVPTIINHVKRHRQSIGA
jgi:uncharacterized membrane protein YdjX (TVP38/TMEM64 family)